MTSWWGALPLAEAGTAQMRIGPFSLWLRREKDELRLAHFNHDLPFDDAFQYELPAPSAEPPPQHELLRLACSPPIFVSLTPLPADRPVIARPEMPFLLPPDGEITAYVSTPLWLRIEAGKASVELPLSRPSDTWFGPSPRDGELCYASRTSLRRRLELLPVRPHRVITRVRIRNRGEDQLALRRLRIPMPHLPLFADDQGAFWTPPILLERAAGDGASLLQLEPNPPDRRLIPIASARRPMADNLVIRVLNSFLP